ncbi:MAG: hypothetical protein QME96_13715, partial [Myxococcota bacterium]|nr:hypothetical protein [Myxococcota bacterium]
MRTTCRNRRARTRTSPAGVFPAMQPNTSTASVKSTGSDRSSARAFCGLWATSSTTVGRRWTVSIPPLAGRIETV